MIFDALDNADRYLPLKREFAKAFEFLGRPDLTALPVGRHEIDGERLYAVVAREPGRSKEGAMLEAHDQYIDIQLVLGGSDLMGWKARSACKAPAGDYDSGSDEQLYSDDPDSWLAVRSGTFVIFFPEDAHLPMISPGEIHKVVVKVAVD